MMHVRIVVLCGCPFVNSSYFLVCLTPDMLSHITPMGYLGPARAGPKILSEFLVLQIYHFYFVPVYYFVKFARIRKCQNAMKKSYILLFAAVVLTVTGCDFLRKLAGRPTSDVIEVKRQEMVADLEAKAAREKAIQDSLDLVAKHEADSVEAWRFIEENDIRIYPASGLGGVYADGLEDFPSYDGFLYRVVVGSFKDESNADKMVAKIWEAGESIDLWAHKIKMYNGMIAVAVRPTNRIQCAVWGIDDLKNCGVCPPDVWILKID